MKLKFLFFFLALLLTAVWTILLVLTLKERGALFYIGEGVITFSLVFLVYFYRKVVKPLISSATVWNFFVSRISAVG